MQKNTIAFCYKIPVIDIQGHEYQVGISGLELYSQVKGYIREVLNLSVNDTNEIRAAIENGCAIVDNALGDGAMVEISAGQPVSLPAVVKILNTILEAVNAQFAQAARRTARA